MEDRLKEIFALVLQEDASNIKEDSSPENIENWDSIRKMYLVAAIEEEFNFQFEEIEIEHLNNYSVIRDIVLKRGKLQ